jgi:hypothetical protein
VELFHPTTLDYRLPASALRFSGTVTVTRDSLPNPAVEVAEPRASVALEVGADPFELAATIKHGLLFDTKTAFKFTDDGRLVSGSVDSVGQAGRVLVGFASLAAADAGLALGVPGLGAGVAGLRRAEAYGPAPPDPVAAWRRQFPHLGELRDGYAGSMEAAATALQEATRTLIESPEPGEQAAAMRQIRRLERAIAVAQRELGRLDQQFKAWRATMLSTRTETVEQVLSLDDLRRAGVGLQGQKLVLAPRPAAAEQVEQTVIDAAIGSVRQLWSQLGIAAVVEDPDVSDQGARIGATMGVLSRAAQGIVVRVPRMVTIAVYRRLDAPSAVANELGRAELVERRPYLVMDRCSAHRTVALRRSMFAARRESLEFSALGALQSLGSDDAASAAAAADAASSLPGAIAGGLDESKKVLDALSGLRERGLDEQLDRVKKEVELKQHELAYGDLLATEGSRAELERLKQQAAMLEQRKAIAGALPDEDVRQLARLTQQVDVAKSEQGLLVAQRQLDAESELNDLRLEVERLKAQKELADAEKKVDSGASANHPPPAG